MPAIKSIKQQYSDNQMSKQINIFDKEQIIKHRIRSLKSFNKSSFLYNIAIDRISGRLEDIKRVFNDSINIGTQNGMELKTLSKQISYKLVIDLDEKLLENIELPKQVYNENKSLSQPRSFDLATSILQLHWINDLPGFLLQIHRSLKPNGLLLANMWGEGTLKELRDCLTKAEIEITEGASPRISPFVDVKSLGMLLQRAGFDQPITDLETITVTYPNIISLFHDLRHMGETNSLIKRGKPLRRNIISLADKLLKENYSDGEGGFYITFDLLTMTALATLAQ